MSTLKADTIQSTGGGAATLTKQAAAKLFLNYDHINNTVKKSLNESSVSDDATGEFTLNFTNNFGDTIYSPSVSVAANRTAGRGAAILGVGCSSFNLINTDANGSYTTSALKMESARLSDGSSDAAAADFDRACLQIFGDLA
jgi:hypothetical protein